MFTGIVEEIGSVVQIVPMSIGQQMRVAAHEIIVDLDCGDSIAVNGVCQTVVAVTHNGFEIQAVGPTLTKSCISEWDCGKMVNLERSLRVDARLGGHIVQGHVDGIGMITAWDDRGENRFLHLSLPDDLMPYMVREGSITIDGVSLTIAALHDDPDAIAGVAEGTNSHNGSIGINVIPHTLRNTTLGSVTVGQRVNVEVDIIGRYVARLLAKGMVPTTGTPMATDNNGTRK